MPVAPIELQWPHRVFFARGLLAPGHRLLRDTLATGAEGRKVRVLVLVDAGLVAADPGLPARLAGYLAAHADVLTPVLSPVVLPGGESSKNDWSLVERLWSLFNETALCRHSQVLAVGGGAFLDWTGFAAATAHRGLRFTRMPTTSLSQADGGLGVKNGVNRFGKKNWIGAFTVPWAVLNDFAFLDHLPEPVRREGLVEAVKVALIRDRSFFEFLESSAGDLRDLRREPLEQAVERSGLLHLRHISTSGDPFELGSARPLDFGHWAAHKLEQLSGFRLAHGPAVAVGLALDTIYARRSGLLAEAAAERILDVLQRLGMNLWHDGLDLADASGKPLFLAGLEEFREHLGGVLTVTLLADLGKGVEVHAMDAGIVLASRDELRARFAPVPVHA